MSNPKTSPARRRPSSHPRGARASTLGALAAAIGLSIAASIGAAAAATPPQPPANQELVLITQAYGSQIYECQTNATWALRAPSASLVEEFSGQIIRHYGAIDRPGVFAGPGPIWQSNIDGSAVRGRVVSSVPNPGAIPLLLLEVAERQGNGMLSDVAYIVRDNTTGGLAPTGACAAGTRRNVPYTAKYRFYAPASVALRGIPTALIPPNQRLRFKTTASGSQIYECSAPTANPNVFTWRFLAPQAILGNVIPDRAPIGLHYGGVLVGATPGPWWEFGGGAVRGSVVSQVPNAGTIPSLLLNIVERDGGSRILDGSMSIVRYQLTGGLMPTSACLFGQRANQRYTATYAFFGAAVE